MASAAIVQAMPSFNVHDILTLAIYVFDVKNGWFVRRHEDKG
jgi:hypothetical protein